RILFAAHTIDYPLRHILAAAPNLVSVLIDPAPAAHTTLRRFPLVKDRLQPLASLDRRKVVHLLPIAETAKNLVLGHVQRLAILDRRHRPVAVIVVVLAETPRPAMLDALAPPAALTLLAIRRDRHA